MVSEYIMQSATIHQKKAKGLSFVILGLIVVLVSMSFVLPVSAITKSVPLTITANFNPAKPSAQFIGDPTAGLAPLTVTIYRCNTHQTKFLPMGFRRWNSIN